MVNMIESRVLEHFWRQWEPHIIYVFHQTAPFPTRIWLPPFSEPVGLHAPPIVSREINMIGMAIAQGLDQRGQVGRDAHGHVLRRVVSRLRGLRAGLQEHPRVLDRDGRATRRRRANTRSTTSPQAYRDLRPQSLYSSPWPARLVAPGRCGGLQRDGRHLHAGVRGEVQGRRCSTTATRPAATRSRKGKTTAPFAYVIPAGAARSRWRPSRCSGAWRSAVSACRS